jgi:hypothetical protein
MDVMWKISAESSLAVQVSYDHYSVECCWMTRFSESGMCLGSLNLFFLLLNYLHHAKRHLLKQ